MFHFRNLFFSTFMLQSLTFKKSTTMKRSPFKTAFTAVLLLLTVSTYAQKDDKSKRMSPHTEASATTADGVKITIDYGSPNVKGREIWGTLVELDKVWRTGADEATTFEVSKDVT